MRLTIRPSKDAEYILLHRISRLLAYLWLVGYIATVIFLSLALLVPLCLWLMVDVIGSNITATLAWEISKMTVTFSFLLAAIGFSLTRYVIMRGRDYSEQH